MESIKIPVTKRKGTKLIHTFPEGEEILGMCTYDDKVIVATNKNVYTLENDELKVVVVEFQND